MIVALNHGDGDDDRAPAPSAARERRASCCCMLAKDPAARSSLDLREAAWLLAAAFARRPARAAGARGARPQADGVVEAARRFEKITVSAADLDGRHRGPSGRAGGPRGEGATRRRPAPPGARPDLARRRGQAPGLREGEALEAAACGGQARMPSADDDDARDDDDILRAADDGGGAQRLAVPPAAASHVRTEPPLRGVGGATDPLARVACTAAQGRRGGHRRRRRTASR